MASKAIRGITVEIGGDTTKLGKALEANEKKSRSLQVELREIEKLLKFDPSNVELMSQKQTVLTQNIEETGKKLDTLKEAEKQVIAQFERGEVAEEQVRALQREILKTEGVLGDMKTELSATEKAINDVVKGTKKVKDNTKEYAEAVEDAKQELNDFKESASEVFDVVKTGAVALGGAVVATGGYALNLSTEFDKAFNTLITKTGASTEEMDSLNEAMENVYANNFGESIEDVADAMATVKTTTNLTGKELENVTQNALLMRDTFGFEVNESIRAVNSLMDQFGISADEAYNLIAQGAQKGLNQNDDLLDTINEYSVQFENAGYTAEDMFNMLANGVETGTWSVDKLGDAVKEFNIRMSDGSAKDAVEALGFSWEAVSESWSKGGDDAKEVFNMLFNELDGLEDTTEGYGIGVGLLGTMYEDLGQDAVLALSQTEGEISKTSDALQQINETKYDDIGSAIQGLGRTLNTDVVVPLGEELKPVVEDAIEYVKANGPQIKDILLDVVSKVGDFVGFVVNNGPTILSVIAGVGTAFVTWKVATMISGLIGVITSFVGVLKTGTSVMGALNAVMGLNPIVLIVSLIAGLVVAFIALWHNCEGFRNFWIGLWEKIKSATSKTVEALKVFFTQTIPETIDKMVNWFKQLPSKISSAIQGAIERVKTWANNLKTTASNGAKNCINAVINFFQTLPHKIGYAIGFVIGKLITWGASMISWVKTNIPKLINNIVTFFSQLPGKIWTWLVNTVTKIVQWGANMRERAVSAISNMISSVYNTAVSLPGKIWSAISGAIGRLTTWGSQMTAKAKSGIKNVANAITNGLKSIPQKITSIGRNIVEGLWNGIKNATGWIKEKVGSFASGILDGMKSALGIKSPSRVFRDEVGKYIAQGIGVGVTENADDPIDALKKLGDDMANQDLALNGATINRKLATTFSVGSANVGMDNASLLNKLDGIYERLGRLQVVLDTGTLVGETIDKIDAGLATKQLLTARGV